MTARMTLPVAAMPAAIADTVAVTLRAHGLSLSPELLSELGRNTTQALYALDESGAFERPPSGELLSVGQTLRALAHAGGRPGAPHADTAPVLLRVGDWLVESARADLGTVKGGKAA